MARSKARAGRSKKTFWNRIVGVLGISPKGTIAAKAKRPSAVQGKKRRNKKQRKHKGSTGRKQSKRRSARRARRHQKRGKRTARHAIRHHSATRVHGMTNVEVQNPTSAPLRARSVWNIPYPHLPKILFTEIELPSPHLPRFHRKKHIRNIQEAEEMQLEDSLVSEDLSPPETTVPPKEAKSRWSFFGAKMQKAGVSAAPTEASSGQKTDSASGDLADLLSDADESEEPKIAPEKKKKKGAEQDIPADLLQKNPKENLQKNPDESQKETVAAQTRADAVAAKRKKSQAAEIVIQAPVHSGKKEEKKIKEKKAEAAEPPTEEQMLQAMEARAKRERKKGFTAFFRSLNNMGMGKHRSAFVQNLAMMLNAGLPLVDALQTIREELRSKPMRKVVQGISDLVEGGNPLWVSMDEQGLFSPYEVSLVRVGEEAGNLARNMEYLSIQQEKDRNLRQKVKMAMIYPTIVLVLMFIVVMGLGMFVLPNLIQVLYALNVELPLSTRLVITFTEFMQKSGAQTGAGIIGGFIVTALLTKYTAFKAVTQWMIFRIPGIGRLAKEASIARFGVILGGLLQAGVPLVESLDSMVEVTTIVSFKHFYRKLRDRVVVGDSFATSFHTIRGSRKVLPVSVQQLIITGEKSGALSDTCLKVAHIYERKAEETAEKLPVILEPTLLLGIGSLVGFIAFSIIVPIYSAVGNVSGG